jgi:hypothetical protein
MSNVYRPRAIHKVDRNSETMLGVTRVIKSDCSSDGVAKRLLSVSCVAVSDGRT